MKMVSSSEGHVPCLSLPIYENVLVKKGVVQRIVFFFNILVFFYHVYTKSRTKMFVRVCKENKFVHAYSGE